MKEHRYNNASFYLFKTLTLSSYYIMQWTDERLAWNGSDDDGGIEMLHVRRLCKYKNNNLKIANLLEKIL